jgi:hypothetical protein
MVIPERDKANMVSCTIVLTFWLEEILGLQHREVVKEI